MPSAAPLKRAALVFASGSAAQNRALPRCFAAAHPKLTLYVVAEFHPLCGEWIPWHVQRSFAENISSIRAALAGCSVEAGALAVATGTAHGSMRRAAVLLCARRLALYGEDLEALPLAALPGWLLRSMVPVRGGRAHQWLRRLRHPGEAEIPVRARLAQLRGVVANRLRRQGREVPLRGREALLDGVTVVVPSRDGCELLQAMLPDLLAQLSQGEVGEVIVVDNGSTDGTAAWLAREHPAIRVVHSAGPLSFARAVNAGIAEGQYRNTLLLNNDMLVEPGFLSALHDAFLRVPDLFCATAQIFFPPGVRREETGKAVWRRENPLDFPMRCDEPCPGEDLTWVFYGSGGCSLFDTAKLRELGGVSEVYEPAYVEDMDFGYRAWKRGWPSVYCAGARVEHRHRATTARFYTPRQLEFFTERNYLRFLIHAVSSAPLFAKLWLEAIRRLQLMGALDVLRDIPRMGLRPPVATGVLSEEEIFALGNGDIACFPGRVCLSHRRPGEKVILIASPYLPFPLSHGGAVRIFNLMKYAARSHGLVLLAYCEELATPPQELLELCCEVVLVKRHGTHYRRDTVRPDVVEEFDSASFRACLKQTAARWKPAVVQLEFTWMAQFAGEHQAAKTILVEHDITFDLQEQLLGTGGLADRELEKQAAKWRNFETNAWRRVDCVVTMSAKDRAMVTGAKAVAVLPNGVDCERFQPSQAAPEPGRVLFIGSFAHLPNLLALEFFLNEVWPLLRGAFRLHVIAGANAGYYLDYHRERVTVKLDQPGIELEGFVSDVREAYRRAEMVIAPLTASAGTNIKVLEAMAMGRVVVSTPAGLNGLDLAPGRDVLLAAGAEDFATEMLALASDPERRQRLEREACQTALRFDWSVIADLQAGLYRE